jgi:hypothetical protein
VSSGYSGAQGLQRHHTSHAVAGVFHKTKDRWEGI